MSGYYYGYDINNLGLITINYKPANLPVSVGFTINSVSYAGTAQSTFSGNLGTGNGILNGNVTASNITYNCYAFGQISTNGTYVINYNCGSACTAYILAVGGGGPGSSYAGAGGGGGGVVMKPINFTASSGTITISIGTGGPGSAANAGTTTNGTSTTLSVSTLSGSAPSLTTITAAGGGYGTTGLNANTAGSGGSGGGASNWGGASTAGTGITTNYNYANSGAATTNGGGGGGAGGVGSGTAPGGGILSLCSIAINKFTPSGYSAFGTYYWAGGGGGAGNSAALPSGGGGNGSSVNGSTPAAGGGNAINTGGSGVNANGGNGGNGGANTGGGGGGGWNGTGGNGGSGILVIAFPTTSAIPWGSPVSTTGLLLYYPFWNDIINYSTTPGVDDGTFLFTSPAYIATTTLISGTRSYNAKAAGSLYNSDRNLGGFNLPKTLSFTGLTAFTISFWFYITNSTSGMLWSMDNGSRVFMWFDGTNLTFSQLTGATIASYTNMNGKWLFATIVVNNSATANSSTIYTNINGSGTIVDPTTNATTFTYGTGYPFGQASPIGRHALFQDTVYAGANTAAAIQGYVNNFYMFNRALTTGEISALYNQ